MLWSALCHGARPPQLRALHKGTRFSRNRRPNHTSLQVHAFASSKEIGAVTSSSTVPVVAARMADATPDILENLRALYDMAEGTEQPLEAGLGRRGPGPGGAQVWAHASLTLGVIPVLMSAVWWEFVQAGQAAQLGARMLFNQPQLDKVRMQFSGGATDTLL